MTQHKPKKKRASRYPRLPDVKSAPARPLVTGRGAAPSYPGAADLIARSPEWRAWLEAALRQVLRPAAIVGAVGLAGLGCDGATAAGIAGQWAADGPTGAATAGPVAFTGGIAPDKFLAGGDVPYHTQGGGAGGVVMGPLPPRLPPSLPPGPGIITPSVDPPELDGDVAMVHPTPPMPPPPPVAPHPPALAGEAPAVVPLPPVRPPAMRGRIRPIRPVAPPPIAPPPDDPPVPGGLMPVMPDAE